MTIDRFYLRLQAQPQNTKVDSETRIIDPLSCASCFTFLHVAGAPVCSREKLLMCPEPVAPAYEYSDVVEEVVKLHPPVGQLLLEEIERWVG